MSEVIEQQSLDHDQRYQKLLKSIMEEKQFNYIIGHLYEDICGNEHVKPFSTHNQEVFFGSLEDAKDSLNDIMCAYQEEDWKIFVLSELDCPQETL